MDEMVIDGVKYIEAPIPKNWIELDDRVCSGCVLNKTKKNCRIAINGLAKEVFGGDCDKNNVVYVVKPE